MNVKDYNHVAEPGELPPKLIGDKIRLTQVIINLSKMA